MKLKLITIGLIAFAALSPIFVSDAISTKNLNVAISDTIEDTCYVDTIFITDKKFDITKELPCKQMYYWIERYAKEYNIDPGYLYAIAYNESKYQGPYHYDYTQSVRNKSGATGPMQIMPATARLMHKKDIDINRLRNDIEFNIRTSCMAISHLRAYYGNDIELAFGAYATGKPCRNSDVKRIMKKSYIWLSESK